MRCRVTGKDRVTGTARAARRSTTAAADDDDEEERRGATKPMRTRMRECNGPIRSFGPSLSPCSDSGRGSSSSKGSDGGGGGGRIRRQ